MNQTEMIRDTFQLPPFENLDEWEYLIDIVVLALQILALFAIIYVLFLKRRKRILNKAIIKNLESLSEEKLIVAIEIKDLFIQYSNRWSTGFEELQISDTSSNIMMKTLRSVLGYTPCFKSLFSLKEIHHFIKVLKNIKDVEVMVYTELNSELTEALLKKLKLTELIPPEHRKFCNVKHIDMRKHAIDVDKDSRRVLILTPNKHDHSWEDEKYFLILKPKAKVNNFLRDSAKMLKSFLEEADREFIHDELAQLKIDIEESDYSDISDYEYEKYEVQTQKTQEKSNISQTRTNPSHNGE